MLPYKCRVFQNAQRENTRTVSKPSLNSLINVTKKKLPFVYNNYYIIKKARSQHSKDTQDKLRHVSDISTT